MEAVKGHGRERQDFGSIGTIGDTGPMKIRKI